MKQMGRLLHLSELLAAATEREVAKCSAALAQANAAITAAQNEADRLVRLVASQKDQVRDLFLGAAHARYEVEMLLSDLTGLDEAILGAEQAVNDAQAARDTCADALADARKAHRAATAKVTRRARIVTEQRHVMARRAEAHAEAEQLDQWTGLQRHRRAP